MFYLPVILLSLDQCFQKDKRGQHQKTEKNEREKNNCNIQNYKKCRAQ